MNPFVAIHMYISLYLFLIASCAPAPYQAPLVLPINDFRTMSEHILEAQADPASIVIHPRAGEEVQTKTYEAFPNPADPRISKINLHHKFGACYILVIPKNQDSLAVIVFDGRFANWDSISSSIDDLRFSAGFHLFSITTTVNYIRVDNGFAKMSENKMYGSRQVYDINKKAPKDGSSLRFALPEKQKELSISFSNERHTLPIK